MSYLKHFNPTSTPQSQPIPGRSDMVPNNAGGYVFKISDWDRLNRFLLLGSAGGTYYVSEKKLTLDSAECVLRCLAEDGKRVVDMIVDVSDRGRSFKNTPAIFALALAASFGLAKINPISRPSLPAKPNKSDPHSAWQKHETDMVAHAKLCEPWNKAAEARAYALDAFATYNVVRIGTHLFQFAEYIKAFRGWGPAIHEAFARWYKGMPTSNLAYQIVKYPSRIAEEGVETSRWSHRDILRKRLGASDAGRNMVFDYAVHGRENLWKDLSKISDGNLKVIVGAERAKEAKTGKEVAEIVAEFGLPHEAIPTEFKKDPAVWEALLPNTPLHATVRNLGSMTANGFLKPMSDASTEIVKRLRDGEYIRKSRLHPISVLAAMKTYAQGHGVRGNLKWEPVQDVVDALDAAMYEAFEQVEPTNKRLLLALDISGSMGMGSVAGLDILTPREAVACMALATAKVEPHRHIMGFSTNFMPLDISPRQRFDQVIKYMAGLDFGETDCSLPMRYAIEKKMMIDAFVIFTDNESWANPRQHPVQALEEYRKKLNPDAKFIVVGTTSTEITVGDPNDANTLQICGFDTSTPNLISEFIKGF